MQEAFLRNSGHFEWIQSNMGLWVFNANFNNISVLFVENAISAYHH
jgi:hypothetical protein